MYFTMKIWTLFFGMLMLANIACAESSQEQLNQMVEQLQKNTNDNTLREKIIKLAPTIKPAPAIPEEARRSFVRGNTAFSEAKSPDDYARAVQRYEEALVLAPWWGDPYFNLAKALELRKEYSRAIQSLRLFVLTNPSPDDARKAQDNIYVLEDKQERMAKESSAKEAAAREEEAKYGWLLGNWHMHFAYTGTQMYSDVSVQISKKGNQVSVTPTSGYSGVYPNGVHFSYETISKSDFRAELSESGDINWQHDFGSGPLQCSSQIGWQNVNAEMSSDRRRITLTAIALFVQPTCTPSGNTNVWTFTRE